MSLRAAIEPATAHAFLAPALGLGLDAVAAVARRKAALGLAAFPADALCALSPHEFEALIFAACGRGGAAADSAEAGSQGPAWAVAWAAVTYYASYSRSERMDDAAHRRLGALVSLGMAKASKGGGALGRWGDEGSSRARHFQDLEVPPRRRAETGGWNPRWRDASPPTFAACPRGG